MSALEMTTPEITRVNLKNIRKDGGTQPRAGIDPITVNEYTESMVAGAEFPPVTLFYDGQWYWLADGFHRVTAAEAAGLEAVRADVRSGEKRDAVLFSVGVNAHHGLRRTNADKRRAVETLLRDEEWRQWSDREIARRVQVDHKTVASVRAQLIQLGEIPRMEERKVERNGTEYHIKTKSSYAPGIAEEADVETARQIALDILGDVDRDMVKIYLRDGTDGVMNEGIAYTLGEGTLNNEKVSVGQIGVLLRTANGEGVYRFDALQLVDWRDQRDAALKEDEVLKALLKLETKTTGWVEGKAGKKLIKFGLAVPTAGNNSTEVRITADGRAAVEVLYEQNPILGVEREIRDAATEKYYYDVTEGQAVLMLLYRQQSGAETWVVEGKISVWRYDKWLKAFAERGFVQSITRPNAHMRHSNDLEVATFYTITPEGAALLKREPLPEPRPLPDLPYHLSADVFVPADAAFKVAVGDVVKKGDDTARVLALHEWPRMSVVRGSQSWETSMFETDIDEIVSRAADKQQPQTASEFSVGDEVITRTGRKGTVTVVNGALVTVDVNGVATNHKRETLSHVRDEETAELDTQIAHVWHSLKTVETAIEQLDDTDLAGDLQELLELMQVMLTQTESGERLGLMAALRGETVE